MKAYIWTSESEDEGTIVLGLFTKPEAALAAAAGVRNAPFEGPKVSSVMAQTYWERDLRPWGVDGRGLSFVVTEVEVEQ